MKKLLSITLVLIMSFKVTAQTLSVDDVTVKAYETAEVNITLTGGSVATAAGFSIVLPEGLSFTGDMNDKTEDHLVRSYLQNARTTKVAIFSTQNQIFSNNTELLSLQVQANTEPGNYQGYITGVEYASNSCVLMKKTDVTFNVNVGINTGINDQKSDIGDSPIYNLSGQRVFHPEKGIYIQNGKKVIFNH